jgi:hypothetical protein
LQNFQDIRLADAQNVRYLPAETLSARSIFAPLHDTSPTGSSGKKDQERTGVTFNLGSKMEFEFLTGMKMLLDGHPLTDVNGALASGGAPLIEFLDILQSDRAYGSFSVTLRIRSLDALVLEASYIPDAKACSRKASVKADAAQARSRARAPIYRNIFTGGDGIFLGVWTETVFDNREDVSFLHDRALTDKEKLSKLVNKALSISADRIFDPEKNRYVHRFDEALFLLEKAAKMRGLPSYEMDDLRKWIVENIETVIDDPESALEAAGPGLSDIQKKFFDVFRKKAVLERFYGTRVRDGHITKCIRPDGAGNYYLDNIGIKGVWTVRVRGHIPEEKDLPFHIMRFVDSLSEVIYGNTLEDSAFFDSIRETGMTRGIKLAVCPDYSDAAVEQGKGAKEEKISLVTEDNGAYTFLVHPSLLEMPKKTAKRYLKSVLSGLAILSSTRVEELPRGFAGREEVPPYNIRELPETVFIDHSGGLGARLLSEYSGRTGVPTQYIGRGGSERFPDLEERIFLKDPSVFCLSLSGYDIASFRRSLNAIRQKYPEAYIIAGGPSAMQPKELISLLPDIDILIRGEAEDVLLGLLTMIGKSRRSGGLSEEMLDNITRLKGVYLRSGDHFIFNHLDMVNQAGEIKIPVLYTSESQDTEKAEIEHLFNMTRGCPHKCNFCTMAMGRRYRCATLDNIKDFFLASIASRVPLPRGITGSLGKIVASGKGEGLFRDDLRALRYEHLYNYVPPGKYLFPKHAVMDIIFYLEENLVSLEPSSVKRLISNISYGSGAASDIREFADLLPAELTAQQLRAIVLTYRTEWIRALISKGEDLYGYGFNSEPLEFFEYVFNETDILTQNKYASGNRKGSGGLQFHEEVYRFLEEMFAIDDHRTVQMMSKYDPALFPAEMEAYKESGIFSGIEGKNISREDIGGFLIILQKLSLTRAGVPVQKLSQKDLSMLAELFGLEEGRYSSVSDIIYALPEKVPAHQAAIAVSRLSADNIRFWRIRRKALSGSLRYSDINPVPNKAVLATSEDNTLVRRELMMDLFEWIRKNKINEYLVLDLGQNSLTTLMSEGEPDSELIDSLSRAGAVLNVFGTDGLSNHILRQNMKAGYSYSDVLGLEKELKKYGQDVTHNHIHSTPFSDAVDVAESLMLLVLTPLKLRDTLIPWIESDIRNAFTAEYVVQYPEYFGSGGHPGIRKKNEGNEIPFAEEYSVIDGVALMPFDPEASSLISHFMENAGKKYSGHKKAIWDMLIDDYDHLVEKVITRWLGREQKDPQLRALGEAIRLLRARAGFFGALGDVFRMAEKEKCDFIEMLSRVEEERAAENQRQLLTRKEREDAILRRAGRYVNGLPVNIHMDMDLISADNKKGDTEAEQKNFEEVLGLIAMYMVRNKAYGINSFYMFKGLSRQKLSDLKEKLERSGAEKGLDVSDTIERIGTLSSSPDAVDLYIYGDESVKGISNLGDKEILVCLEENEGNPWISIPDYGGAMAMGLLLAGLKHLSLKASYDPENNKANYFRRREEAVEDLKDILQRIDGAETGERISRRSLELMINGNSDSKMYYARVFSLPPAVKATIQLIDDYYRAMRNILHAA